MLNNFTAGLAIKLLSTKVQRGISKAAVGISSRIEPVTVELGAIYVPGLIVLQVNC
jgi:hypothetical protein